MFFLFLYTVLSIFGVKMYACKSNVLCLRTDLMSIPEYILVLTLGLSDHYILHICFLTRPKKMYEKLRAANFDIARPRSWFSCMKS